MGTVWQADDQGGTGAEAERLVSAHHTDDDLEIDRSLRPRRLDDTSDSSGSRTTCRC